MARHESSLLEGLAAGFLQGEGPSSTKEAFSILSLLAGALEASGPADERAAIEPVWGEDVARDEKQLRLVEARYRTLVEQIPAVVFLASLERDLNDIYVNPQIETLLGFTQQEWASDPVLWFRQLHPDDRSHLSREFASACITGRPFRGTVRVHARDGKLVWVHAEARLVRDGSGRPLFLHGVAFDITEQQKAQETREQLAATEAASRRASFLAQVSHALASSLDYEAILNEVARLVVPEIADLSAVDMVQPDGTMKTIAVAHRDPQKLTLFRVVRERYPVVLNAPRGAGRAARTGETEMVSEVDEALLRGAARDEEHFALLGELGPRSYMSVPMRGPHRVHGTLTLMYAESGRRYGPEDRMVAEDVAQRAALAIDNAHLYREAREASRLKDEFLATLSHELRTPLNAIVGWAHILQDTTRGLSPQATKAVETIVRNAHVQSQLIADILDVSRIIAGKLVLNVKPLDLSTIVEAALDTVRPAAAAKGIELQPVFDDSAAPISGDPDRLQQVVWNLVSNAIKFASQGGRVEVRLEELDSSVRITVTDDGPGINPAFLPFVFERFRQADSSSSRRHGGLGLGLAIVRHLVELHGGTVKAANREGPTGAIFEVNLPRRSDAAERPRALERHRAETMVWLESAPSLKGLSVLVVDDEPDARDMVTNVLERCGAHAVATASAVEAFAALRQGRFDVLLADVEMPDEDGYALMRRVRGLPPRQGGLTPAAALTAYASAQDRVKVLDAGFQMHVPKPVQPAELAAVVASLARTRPARRR